MIAAPAPFYEKDVVAAMIAAIKEELAARGIKDCRVLRNYQERQIGRERDKPAIFIHKLFESRYAFAHRAYEAVAADGTASFIEREEQAIRGTYQISAIAGNEREDDDPNDYLRIAADAMQLAAGVGKLRAAGIRPEKIMQTRQMWIKSEENNSLAFPSFDVVLQWKNVKETPIDAAETEGTVHAVQEKG